VLLLLLLLLLLLQVHKGFLTSFNDLMTGGDNKQETMAEVAKELMDGKEPARCVDTVVVWEYIKLDK
jgi:hypothetical protein